MNCRAILISGKPCNKPAEDIYCKNHLYILSKTEMCFDDNILDERGLIVGRTLLAEEKKIDLVKIDSTENNIINTCTYLNRKLIKYEEYYSSGLLRRVENYKWSIELKKSVIHGYRYMYFSDGSLESKEYYVNGYLEGEQCYFYKNGKYKNINNYKSGILNDTQISYSESGDIISYNTYTNGILSGNNLVRDVFSGHWYETIVL